MNEPNTPHYMERYWLDVRETAQRQVEIANRELGKIALQRQQDEYDKSE